RDPFREGAHRSSPAASIRRYTGGARPDSGRANRFAERHIGRAGDTLWPAGEVSERSKERDWKSRTGRKVRRGFKSRPLRCCRWELRLPLWQLGIGLDGVHKSALASSV